MIRHKALADPCLSGRQASFAKESSRAKSRRSQTARAKADKLIVALDVDRLSEVKRLLKVLKGTVKIFKVGNELFTSRGPDVVKLIHKSGVRVFLDLKFHDIPNTVAKAAEAAASLGVFMMNVHTSGGPAMMKEASVRVMKKAKALGIEKPILLGVTVLTSFDERELKNIGVDFKVRDQVIRLAQLARTSGLDGVVVSAQEAKDIRQKLGKKFIIVTPGVRPQDGVYQDQRRVVTPKEAIQNGADYIVVGRPITEARDPLKVAQEILNEID